MSTTALAKSPSGFDRALETVDRLALDAQVALVRDVAVAGAITGKARFAAAPRRI